MENFVGNLEFYLHGSYALAFLAAYVGGLLVGFTPCVYPVVPIIIGFIGARDERSRLSVFSLSIIYVAGMALTYTALGGFAALSGKLFGQIQTNPWLYLIAGNICLFLGLSMLDMIGFHFPMPGFMQKIQNAGRGGFLGSFFLGATSGVLVGPCTAPVLAILLLYVASKQNVIFGTSLLFVFAFGMGTLMIILGTFAGLIASLPKSGGWMVWIKKIFGWILVGVGEYYLVGAGRLWL
jgi:thiol:disulfide interchange protein DsbD